LYQTEEFSAESSELAAMRRWTARPPLPAVLRQTLGTALLEVDSARDAARGNGEIG